MKKGYYSKILTKYDKIFSPFYAKIPQFTVLITLTYNEEWRYNCRKIFKNIKILLLEGEMVRGE